MTHYKPCPQLAPPSDLSWTQLQTHCWARASLQSTEHLDFIALWYICWQTEALVEVFTQFCFISSLIWMFLQHFHYNPAQWGTQVRSDPNSDQNTESSLGSATAFRHRSRLGFIPYSSKCPVRPRYILLEKLKQFSSTRWHVVKKPTAKIKNASKTFSKTCKYAILPKALVFYGLSF